MEQKSEAELIAVAQANIGLNILSVSDVSKDKFMDLFTIDEAKWALTSNEGLGFIARNPLEADRVRDYLQLIIDEEQNMLDSVEEYRGQMSPQGEQQVIVPAQGGSSPHKESSRSVAGRVADYVPVLGGQEVIETDKGAYYSVPVLKDKLKKIYPIEKFDDAFTLAMEGAKVDPTVDYLSAPKKKSVCNKMKAAIKQVIADEIDNVMEED